MKIISSINIKYTFILIFSFSYSLLLAKSDIKNPISKKYQIKFISQVSSSKDLSNNHNLVNRIFNFFLLGKKCSLIKPVNLLSLEENSLYVMDQGSQLLAFINYKTNDFNFLNSNQTTQFPSLVGICSDGDKNIFFTDSKLNKIFCQNTSSGSPRSLINTPLLNQPTGIAYSIISDQIWVVETAAHRLAILNKNGELVKYIGERGTKSGQFNFPTFIWIDKIGTVYVVDSMNYRIQILSSDGIVKTVFGKSGDATGYFGCPKGIATDSYGHIYVVDAIFHTVQVFDNKGEFLYNFGQQGHGNGEFWLPCGIYIDNNDLIYVADTYNGRVQIFQLVDRGADEN